MAEVITDISRAQAKIKALLGIDQLALRKLGNWQTTTVAILKRRAQMMQKSGAGRKTGHLARNIGAKTVQTRQGVGSLVGTGGEVGQKPVVYASIQDKGGTIRPKRKKWLAVPLPGTKGIPENFPDSFIVKSKAGRLLIVQRKWMKVRGGANSRQTSDLVPLFVLKKEVKLPPTFWFTNVIRGRAQELERVFEPTALVDELLNYGQAAAIQD